nr:hypothetical protein CFP56_70597 [Quercus suber]
MIESSAALSRGGSDTLRTWVDLQDCMMLLRPKKPAPASRGVTSCKVKFSPSATGSHFIVVARPDVSGQKHEQDGNKN